MDASHVYVRAGALGCFSQFSQYPNLSEGAGRVGGQLRGDKECPFSGVTKSGRDWRKVQESDDLRKVPESDARSVRLLLRRKRTLARTNAIPGTTQDHTL